MNKVKKYLTSRFATLWFTACMRNKNKTMLNMKNTSMNKLIATFRRNSLTNKLYFVNMNKAMGANSEA